MSAIYAVIMVFVGIFVIGFIFAIAYNKKDDDDNESSIVVTQEVPSVFDLFAKKTDGRK